MIDLHPLWICLYLSGAAVALVLFALPRVGEAYEDLARARLRAAQRPSDARDDHYLRDCARDYLLSLLWAPLLVLGWPLVLAGWLVLSLLRVVWEAI